MWRRGHQYGSILVDLERNQVVDFLADRQAEILSHWLRQHPGVALIARNRACTCADGARQRASGADCWHLQRNLDNAVQAVVEHHHAAVRQIGREVSAGRTIRAAAAVPTQVRPSAAQRRQEAGRLRW